MPVSSLDAAIGHGVLARGICYRTPSHDDHPQCFVGRVDPHLRVGAVEEPGEVHVRSVILIHWYAFYGIRNRQRVKRWRGVAASIFSTYIVPIMEMSGLVLESREEPAVATQRIIGAVLGADGDMNEAASALGVRRRTLYRCIEILGLKGRLEEIRVDHGWTHRITGDRGRTEAFLRWFKGIPGGIIHDYGVPAERLYGEDTAVTRQRIHSLVHNLVQSGILRRLDEGIWEVVK